MNYKTDGTPIVAWFSLEEFYPPFYVDIWTADAKDRILLDRRIIDSYHGADRIKFENSSGWSGFPDLVDPSERVTHWALYEKPPKPDVPTKEINER